MLDRAGQHRDLRITVMQALMRRCLEAPGLFDHLKTFKEDLLTLGEVHPKRDVLPGIVAPSNRELGSSFTQEV